MLNMNFNYLMIAVIFMLQGMVTATIFNFFEEHYNHCDDNGIIGLVYGFLGILFGIITINFIITAFIFVLYYMIPIKF